MEEQKIFTLDDEDYYADRSLMEFLNWYNKNIDPLETAEQLQGLGMHDPEDIAMWSPDDDATPEELEKELKRVEQSELCQIKGVIYRSHKYAEYIDEDAKEPYLIAT